MRQEFPQHEGRARFWRWVLLGLLVFWGWIAFTGWWLLK